LCCGSQTSAGRTCSTGRLRLPEAIWAEATGCDAEGRLDLYGLQALVMRAVVESGECFVRLLPTESTVANWSRRRHRTSPTRRRISERASDANGG
jgi:capsid protein